MKKQHKITISVYITLVGFILMLALFIRYRYFGAEDVYSYLSLVFTSLTETLSPSC
ncbi:hypothetical protein [Aquimarina spongiae]|uniref:hypothetical protein n=1 Tax=Aquimarina spongiae TaxID=570521 RepID=UPI001479E0C6|nr:hypothetical protein [Aquimarina spongiae]